MTDVRRRVTWDTHGRRGRKCDPAWAARRRLLRGWERLSPAQFTKMWNDLVDGEPRAHKGQREHLGTRAPVALAERAHAAAATSGMSMSDLLIAALEHLLDRQPAETATPAARQDSAGPRRL